MNYPDQDFFDDLDSFDHPDDNTVFDKTNIESDMFDAFHHIQSWYISDI